AWCGTAERESGSSAESQGRGSESRTRFRIVHGTGMGATDIGAARTRPFNDDGASEWSAAADVLVGSGGVRDRRRAGRGRFAARGGGAGAGDGGDGKGQGIGERHGTGPRAADRARGGFAAAGTRGTGKTGERHRSGGESGNQHEAAAFRAGRSRKIVILCWERWQARNTVRERISLAKHQRIDSHGRRGICAIAERVLASGTPASRPFRSDQRLVEKRRRSLPRPGGDQTIAGREACGGAARDGAERGGDFVRAGGGARTGAFAKALPTAVARAFERRLDTDGAAAGR